jgi:hypothetical protein
MLDTEKTISIRIEIPSDLHEKVNKLKGLKSYESGKNWTNQEIYIYMVEKVLESELD